MNIVMVSAHACIRVQKVSLPLLEAGHNVHLVAQKLPSFYESYNTVSLYQDAGQLINIIDLFEKSGMVDLYHCHNEPSWFVTLLKERTKKPVILDVHDSFLTRLTEDEVDNLQAAGKNPVRIVVEERTNFQMADALVFVSDRVKEKVCSEFNLNQPSLILPSYVPEFLYKYNFGRWIGGLTYEGKVCLPSEVGNNNRSWGFDYCDYTSLADDCHKAGVDFHLYSGRSEEKFHAHYANSFSYPGYPYRDLLTCVSRHDWGLVGNTLKTSQWDETLPNKLFEYLACGVPVVAINAKASSELIEEYDIGITVGSIQELAERWREHRDKRVNVIKRRKELSMDSNIHKVVKFYEGVLNATR